MEKETICILAIHPECGVVTKKIEVTSEDDDFINEEYDEFESFGDYVDYCKEEGLAEFEQSGHVAITVNEFEIDAIVEELLKLKSGNEFDEMDSEAAKEGYTPV